MRKITKYSNLRETRILPEECWIFENKQFVLHSPSKSFPLVSAKYEHVLKRNGIPYKLGKKIGEIQFLEYWNPDYYYETEKTLPLYARSGSRGFSKNYIVTGKTYTEKVPTEETIRAAHNFLQKVESLIEEEERRQKLLDIERRCKDALKDDLAVAIQLEKQEAYILDKEIFFKSAEVSLKNWRKCLFGCKCCNMPSCPHW